MVWGKGEGLTIACIVAVAVHEGDFNTIVEEVGEILNLAATDIRAGVVANAVEGFIDAICGLGVVDGHTQCCLHIMLGQIAKIIARWERIRINGRNVVVVASRLVDVLSLDFIGAVIVCRYASLVDGIVVAGRIGVALGC